MRGAVAVSSQRDGEHALVDLEKQELATSADSETAELAGIYRAKGLSSSTAAIVASELMAHDALGAHLDAELNLDPNDTASPVQAAAASAFAFTLGALLPLLAMMLSPQGLRVPITVIAVLVALGAAGAASARVGGSSPRVAVLRIVIGGAAGLAFTYAVGHFFGTAIA